MDHIGDMVIRGFKRASLDQEWQSTKRPRTCKASQKIDRDDLSSENSQLSGISDDDQAKTDKSVTTPLTSRSASSPRYPSNAKTIPCTFDGCGKLFNRQAKLIQHLRSHTDTRPFVCPRSPCTKAYLRDTHLQHHIKSAHSQIRDYVCTWEGCGKAFATGTRFRRHVAAHEGNTKTCTIDGCGQVFRKHSTLEVHIKKVHQGLKPYVCQYLDVDAHMCGIGFDSSAQLRSHEGRMHSRNTFECTICISEEASDLRPIFPTYGALQEHIKADHPPTCDMCGLACASKSSLKSHIEVKHGDLVMEERKKFTCPMAGCGRGFTKKGNMNVHIQSAHNNKRYVCGTVSVASLHDVEGWDTSAACGDDFSTKANLEKHIRTTHMGSANEGSSNKQRRGFKAKSAPATHARITEAIHEEISCTVLGCSASFLTAFDLASHLRARHGLADFEVGAMVPVDHDHEAVFARPGFQGVTAFATGEDLDAEAAFDMQIEAGTGLNMTMQDSHDPSSRRSFWLGGVSDEGTNSTNEWQYDEQEMRRLISDGLHDMEDTKVEASRGEMDIDPMLL